MSAILSVHHALLEPRALGADLWPGMRAWPVSNLVGESPSWHAASASLLWIDVRAPAVLRLHPASRRCSRWTLPEVVGALALVDDDTVVLAMRRSLAKLELSTGRLWAGPQVEDEPTGNRLNDGKLSNSGRWWVFGSMDDAPTGKRATGSLYRAAADGSLRRLHTGLTVANGIAFSPDSRTLYFSDSRAGLLYRAAWDESRGTIGPVQPWCVSDETQGRPDGAMVDAQGIYWSAGVSAGCLNAWADDGRLLRKLALPCRFPTMPCVADGSVFVTSLQRSGVKPHRLRLDGALIEIPWPSQ